jgi:cytosine/uracil/thiamine/allantoin permease
MQTIRVEERARAAARPDLSNEDLAPTTAEQRTWSRWNVAALWIGLSVCVPTYMLAAGLLRGGMTWGQALATIALGNLIVLGPMILNAHAGTKFGIPFPVLVRASFGTAGSNVPALARAAVACGWFGIQTWLGGAAIYELLAILFPGWKAAPVLGPLGINAAEAGCFFAFWLVNVWFIARGTESIRLLESAAAPFLILIGIALLGWGIRQGGSMSAVLAESEAFARPSAAIMDDGPQRRIELRPLDRATKFTLASNARWQDLAKSPRLWLPFQPVDPGTPLPALRFGDDAGHTSAAIAPAPAPRAGFWSLFFPALLAVIGYWATMAINISDFTRFAKSQRDQAWGQVMGLPATMALYSFIGIAATSAALLAFPDILAQEDAPWHPVALLSRFRSPALVATSVLAILVATLTTNIAANVVAPAYAFSNLAPRRISFRTGALATAVLGVLMMPWKLLEANRYLESWLRGSGVFLAPIAGIMIADYFVVRRARLAVGDLYRPDGRYGRWNARTLAVFAATVLPGVPGFLAQGGLLAPERVPAPLRALATYAWFFGFIAAFLLHSLVAIREKE